MLKVGAGILEVSPGYVPDGVFRASEDLFVIFLEKPLNMLVTIWHVTFVNFAPNFPDNPVDFHGVIMVNVGVGAIGMFGSFADMRESSSTTLANGGKQILNVSRVLLDFFASLLAVLFLFALQLGGLFLVAFTLKP